MALATGFGTDEDEELEVKRLTPQEAQALRESDPALSPWWVVGLQCVAGVALVLVAWGVSGKASVIWSVAYGALAVIVPAALFARGLMSQFSSLNAATATFGFIEAVHHCFTRCLTGSVSVLIGIEPYDICWKW